MAEVALDGEVGLLRVGVDEVLALGIAEGLEAERETGREVVLIEEQGIGQEGIEALRVGRTVAGGLLITKQGVESGGTGRALRGGGEVALENRDGVQVRGTPR